MIFPSDLSEIETSLISFMKSSGKRSSALMLSLASSLSSLEEYRSVTRTNFLPPASWNLMALTTEIRASLPMKLIKACWYSTWAWR